MKVLYERERQREKEIKRERERDKQGQGETKTETEMFTLNTIGLSRNNVYGQGREVMREL